MGELPANIVQDRSYDHVSVAGGGVHMLNRVVVSNLSSDVDGANVLRRQTYVCNGNTARTRISVCSCFMKKKKKKTALPSVKT